RRRERAVHRTARASGGARRDGGALGGAGAVSALGARNKEPGGACAGGWGLKRSRTTEGPARDGGAFGRLGEGADQMVASASAGQLILIWTPLGVEAISTSSARPAMTARPSSAAPSPAKPCSNFSASEAPERPPAPSSAGTVSLTVTSKRRSAPRSSRRTGPSGQCLRCASTARAPLPHREPDLVQQVLGDAAAAGDGGHDQPGGPDVDGQRAEGQVNGRHLSRGPPTWRPSASPGPPRSSRGYRRPWSAP